MFKIFVLILAASLSLRADEMLSYYQKVLKTLKIDQQYQLETKRGELQVSGANVDRFTNLSFDMRYTRTKADTLQNGFDVMDLSAEDSFDLFGKYSDAVKVLELQSEGNLEEIQMQKRALYGTLVQMVTRYRKSEKLLELYTNFYREQSKVYDSMQKGVAVGGFARMDARRFANALAMLKNRIINERQSLQTMRTQLLLYAPGSQIPDPRSTTIECDKKRFLSFDPALRHAKTKADISHLEAKSVAKEWRPEALIGTAYQSNGDPTSYGDNYSVYGGIRFGFSSGIGKRIEAAKTAALKADTAIVGARIAAEQRFYALQIAYKSARERMEELAPAIKMARENAEAIKAAYLKHYVDFNTYLQTMQQLLALQEQHLDAHFEHLANGMKLDACCQGKIYE